ncbi:MAG: beta-galactosidase [Clostridia bacterium]|nr:beta-galactosidase [Clostridia bacterium]
MKQKFFFSPLSIGTCYYPEHWDKTLWEEDLRRMLSHGVRTVRIAEFAWNKIEPREGVFDFSFFDEFLSLCETLGMKVIFGTPTATPPAWLTQAYPEVLNARIDGTLLRHGARRHYNYNSPKYRELCARIVEQIAIHYGKHPSIIGWQIDNELNCELMEFYSESDSVAFRAYLKEKFGTLDELNEKLGTTFWNQTYTAWEELYVPRPTISGAVNPHLMLEYKRFISKSVLSFAKIQADILRAHIPETAFVTTNGLFGNVDNHDLEDTVLDVYTYDSYPNFAYMADAPSDGMRDRWWSRNLTKVRSVCKHFGIMEQQSGANGWNTGMEAPAPKPGQMKLWAMQSVAHGADYVSFFRWRTSPMGTEIYWHGLLDYDNRDNRRIRELDELDSLFGQIKEICGEDYVARVAIVEDYDNQYDAELDVWHGRLVRSSNDGLFAAMQYSHTPFDIVDVRDDFSAYSVLFYPHPAIMTDETIAKLERYVSEGGTLVIGCRFGYKDEYGKCPVGRILPHLPFAGVTVKESTFVNPDGVKVSFGGRLISANWYRDVLEPTTATVLGTYTGDYYEGEPALTEQTYGKGKVLVYGSTFGEEREILDYLGVSEPFKDLIVCARDVEIAVRGKYLILLNYAPTAQICCLSSPLVCMDGVVGTVVEGELELPPYGVKVCILA